MMIVNNQVVSAPTVISSITDGSAFVEGAFTAREASTLAVQLQSKPIPSPVIIISGKVKSPGVPVPFRIWLISLTLAAFGAGAAFFVFKTTAS